MIKLPLSPAHRRDVAIVAMGLAVILFGDVVYQTVMHVVWHQWINRYAVAAQPASTQPASTQPTTAPAEKPPKPIQVSAAIRKRNIFAPPVPKGHQLTLTGILGRLVFFRTKQGESITIEEGSSDRGVTVKSINGYEVTIEYEGKPQTMKLFDRKAGGDPSGGAPGASANMRMERPGRPMPTLPPPNMPPPRMRGSPSTSRPAPGPRQPIQIEPSQLPEGVHIEDLHMEIQLDSQSSIKTDE